MAETGDGEFARIDERGQAVDADGQRLLTREPQHLPVRLSPEECRVKARHLGALVRDRRDAEATAKRAAQDAKQRIAGIEASIEYLAEQVATEHVNAPVMVKTLAIGGEAVAIREDTGEEIGRRALTADERQEGLFRETAGAAGRKPRRGRR